MFGNTCRACFFVFYDEDGIVDDYVKRLVCELKNNADDLYIAVNGKIEDGGKAFFKEKAVGLLIRENKGYDAAAYADLIVDVIGKERLKKYDELVLCNDTFYGPFVPLESIFKKMENKDSDFWGMDIYGKGFFSYVIPYFLVLKNRILQDGFLFDFFYKNIYKKIESRVDIRAYFEYALFNELKKNGFLYDTYTNSQNVLSVSRPDICIQKYGLPILKKKFFSSDFYDEKIAQNAISYIETHSDYDVKLILSSANRLLGLEKRILVASGTKPLKYQTPTIKTERILLFIRKHKCIYIYGLGDYAKAVYAFFSKEIDRFKGFVVSDENRIDYTVSDGNPVVLFNKELLSNSGIIVALNEKNTNEVKGYLGKADNILYFW